MIFFDEPAQLAPCWSSWLITTYKRRYQSVGTERNRSSPSPRRKKNRARRMAANCRATLPQRHRHLRYVRFGFCSKQNALVGFRNKTPATSPKDQVRALGLPLGGLRNLRKQASVLAQFARNTFLASSEWAGRRGRGFGGLGRSERRKMAREPTSTADPKTELLGGGVKKKQGYWAADAECNDIKL